MTAKSLPAQQNRFWPPSTTDYGTAAAEPLLRQGDIYYNTTSLLYRKCDSATYPATWSDVGTAAKGTFVGALNQDISLINVEVVIGGFIFDGSTKQTSVFHMFGRFSPATSGDARVRLYDTGPVGGAAITPVLRSTLSINFSAGSNILDRQQGLTKTASPGVNTNTIFNTARVYELRAILDAATLGDLVKIHWAGIEVS